MPKVIIKLGINCDIVVDVGAAKMGGKFRR
jgi:hypothetical protein